MTTNVHEDALTTFGADDRAGRTAPKVHAEWPTAASVRRPVQLGRGPPTVVGGGSQAPSPTAYLRGALSACAVAFAADTLAPDFGVTVESLSADASCTADVAGLVGMPGRDPRLLDLALTVTMSAHPADRVAALQTAWEERCPIYLALSGPDQVAVTWTTP